MARKPRFLTKLCIDEVSSCDVGAGEGTRIVLMKRHDRTPRQRYADVFRRVDFSKLKTNPLPVDDDIDEDLDNGDDVTDGKLSPQLEQMISAMIVALPQLSRQQAAHWLLNTASGRSLAEHLSSTTKSKEQPMIDRSIENLRSIAKQYGMTAVAKHIISKGGTAVDEHAYTDMWKTEAGSTAAFAKEFAGPRNEKHEAYEIIRNAGYVKALGYPDTADDSVAAYEKLQKMAGELRATQPELSAAQSFSKVFLDPANASLANVAHRRPSAG